MKVAEPIRIFDATSLHNEVLVVNDFVIHLGSICWVASNTIVVAKRAFVLPITHFDFRHLFVVEVPNILSLLDLHKIINALTLVMHTI